MTIDDFTKIAQICFYIVIASVAVLTYLKAKHTLLNSVNTEYHKHVIDALLKVSNTLFSEFDEESENYWVKGIRVKDVIDQINKEFLENKDIILKSGEFNGGIPIADLEKRLMAQIKQYKSDPFLPEEVRTKIIDLLQNRFEVYHAVSMTEYQNYRNELASGKQLGTLEHNWAWVSNKINEQLYERGCGISQIEEAVHEIRLDIKNYLEKFNPLKNA